MLFQTYGDRRNPAVLFFHAMGVTGASSEPIARYLQDRYFCILPTSTVYCEGQKYVSKLDEIRQVEDFLHRQGVERLAMVVASSIGADLAMAFLTQTKLPVEHAFFDGGQFAQIGKGTRRIMTPFLYFAIKSLYWSKGGTLKKILWCDDDSIKSYFIDAGKNLTYTNLRRQMADSLEDKPFPPLPEKLQEHIRSWILLWKPCGRIRRKILFLWVTMCRQERWRRHCRRKMSCLPLRSLPGIGNLTGSFLST